MQLHQIFIGLAIGAFFLIGGLSMLGSLVSTYNSNVDITVGTLGELKNYSDRVNANLSNTYESTKDKTLLAEITGGEETEQSLIKGAYNSIKEAPKTARLAVEGIGIFMRALGIPAFVQTLAVSLLFIMLLFAIVYLIFKFKG